MDEEKLEIRLDAAEAKIKSLETDLGKAQAEVATANAALETYRAAERKDAREKLETAARAVLGAEAKFEGLTDRQIREAAILKVQPEKKLDSVSDDYVAGAFDHVAGAVRNDALGEVRAALEAPRTDGVKSPKQVREESIAKRNNAWLKDKE